MIRPISPELETIFRESPRFIPSKKSTGEIGCFGNTIFTPEDPFITEQRRVIARAIDKLKVRPHSGEEIQGLQAQCALLGHVEFGSVCLYCRHRGN